MKKSIIESKFVEYCLALNIKSERNYFLDTPNGDREYICATPGTIYLTQSDPRAGKYWAIAQNGERGTNSIIYGYANIYQVYGYMDGVVKSQEKKLPVFNTPSADFKHPSLQFDWGNAEVNENEAYILDNIGRTQIEPEQWELIFRSMGNEELFEYTYDNEHDAQSDWNKLQELTAI